MRIQVVNVRGLKTREERARVVYCGRPCAGWKGHELANPFALQNPRDPREREECLARYRAWLASRVTLETDLARLWEECEYGKRGLGCWCSPLPCHCDVLAEMLAERFGGVVVTDDDGEAD
jgi:hypothetical protein